MRIISTLALDLALLVIGCDERNSHIKDLHVKCPCGYKCAWLKYDTTTNESYCGYCKFRTKGRVMTFDGPYDENRWVDRNPNDNSKKTLEKLTQPSKE